MTEFEDFIANINSEVRAEVEQEKIRRRKIRESLQKQEALKKQAEEDLHKVYLNVNTKKQIEAIKKDNP